MQVVGYERDTGEGATLVLASDGTVSREPLDAGRRLAYELGSRHCAGAVADGDHTSCSASQAPYCPDHRSRWACARCRGDCDLPLESCREEHAVYLAAFAPATFKVGVTRSWRLPTRLREQGADRAAHLRTVEDGRVARQIEADIAAEVGDRVRVPTKLRGLAEQVDESAWAALLDDFDPIETFALDYGLALDDRPLAATLATGTVRGTKGRVLVLDNGGSTYAVDMRDLVGHDLTARESRRSLQRSLDAFE